jgi:rhamnosyltransferase subunit B
MTLPPATTQRRRSHVVLATSGSLGDLYPFLALGCELQRRGHRATIATTANHRHHVERAGLGFRHMRPEPENSPAFQANFMHPKTGGEFVYKSFLAPAIRDSYADLTKATADADMLISQSLMALAAPLVAARSGIPWLSAVFQPMTLFSLHERPNYLPYPFLPWLCAQNPEIHGRVFHYVRKYTEEWVKPVLQFRQELGLDLQGHPMYEGQHSPQCVLAMFSPLLGGAQPDWPKSAVQTGTAQFAAPQPGDAPEALSITPELEAFLSRDDRPLVIFTLSSTASDTGSFYTECLKAAGTLGVRALLITSGQAASRQLSAPMQEWAMRLDYAPFEKIFPHAAVVVHAGGIGTGFKALQAGVPQILIPQAHDQLDNAMRMERLGVATLIRRSRVGAGLLAKALRTQLADDYFRRRAEEVARVARDEDGAAMACDVIERHLVHG